MGSVNTIYDVKLVVFFVYSFEIISKRLLHVMITVFIKKSWHGCSLSDGTVLRIFQFFRFLNKYVTSSLIFEISKDVNCVFSLEAF